MEDRIAVGSADPRRARGSPSCGILSMDLEDTLIKKCSVYSRRPEVYVGSTKVAVQTTAGECRAQTTITTALEICNTSFLKKKLFAVVHLRSFRSRVILHTDQEVNIRSHDVPYLPKAAAV